MAYRQRYGSDPADQDLKAVERDAWRALLNERMFAQEAKRAGLKATDGEVLVGMRTNPPTVLLAQPAFQTDGKFDANKYLGALANPQMGSTWAPFEDMLRQTLPVKKLQERLLASIKLTQPELQQAFRDRFERTTATLLLVPAADTGRSSGSEEVLTKTFETYKSRMASSSRTQLEVLAVPVVFAEDETKAAMEMGRSLYERTQRGEDFGQLARDYSEGPNATRGGLIDRWLTPNELGTMIGAAVQAKKPGELIEPLREGGRVMLFKIMDPAQDTSGQPHAALTGRGEAVADHHQGAPVRGVVPQAARRRAGDRRRAPSRWACPRRPPRRACPRSRTGYYDQSNGPQQLLAVPEVSEWGLSASKGRREPGRTRAAMRSWSRRWPCSTRPACRRARRSASSCA
jgi:hypothetical protein